MKAFLLTLGLLVANTTVCAQMQITAESERGTVLPLLKDAVSTMEAQISPSDFQYAQCPIYLRPGERSSVACSSPGAQKNIALRKLLHQCKIYRDDLDQEHEAKPWQNMAEEDIEYYSDEVLPCFAFANELKASRK